MNPLRTTFALALAALVTIVSAPADAGGDIGDPARLAAVLLGGEKLDLEQWKGRVVMVSFWATWCAVCRAEMPGWEKFYEANRARGFEMVAMSVDDGEDEVRAFIGDHPYRFPVGWRFDKAEDDDFPTVRATPTTFLIDRQGRIALKHIGRMPEGFLRRNLDALLAR